MVGTTAKIEQLPNQHENISMPPKVILTALYDKDTKNLNVALIFENTKKYSANVNKELSLIDFINLEQQFQELPFKKPPTIEEYVKLINMSLNITLKEDDNATLILEIPQMVRNFIFIYKENMFIEGGNEAVTKGEVVKRTA